MSSDHNHTLDLTVDLPDEFASALVDARTSLEKLIDLAHGLTCPHGDVDPEVVENTGIEVFKRYSLHVGEGNALVLLAADARDLVRQVLIVPMDDDETSEPDGGEVQ